VKEKTMNMTSGNPIRLLLTFAVPMLVGNIFQQFYNLVDSIIVGKFVGANALAAVGASGSVTFMFFALIWGISSGAGVVTAQCFGGGNPDRVKRSIANAAYIMVTSAVLIAGTAFFMAEPVLILMKTPKEVLYDAKVYMQIQCIGVILVAGYNFAASMVTALGDSRTPLFFLIFSCILNIGLDLLFVCVFDIGVLGAAVATAMAEFIAGIGCIYYAFRYNSYFKLTKQHLPPDKAMLWGAVRIGIPLALQNSLIAVSCAALQSVVNSFGAIAVAAFTATGRVEQLLHQPYASISAAMSTYSGQNLGAGKKDRLLDGYRKMLLVMTGFSVVMWFLMQVGGGWIVSVFVNDPEVIALGKTAMCITSWFYIPLGFINVTRGMLNGVGDAAFALINGIVEMFGRVLIPLGLLMIPDMGVWSVWWATGLTWLVSAFFCMLRYFSWKKKVLGGKDDKS